MAKFCRSIFAPNVFKNMPKTCTQLTVVRSFMRLRTDDGIRVRMEMLRRKKDLGPEKPVHRNTWLEWNYKAELFAFANRIKEEFKGDSLERALTQRSYVIFEEHRQHELDIDDPESPLQDNQVLAERGEALMQNFVAKYLRTALPRFPEEGILAVHNHLLQEENLACIVSNIGAEELILCTDFPAEKKTLASTMKSLVGAVEESSGSEKAALFVRDLVISTLSGQEINDIWHPEEPMNVLSEILMRDGRNAPEPRLLALSGINTIIPCFQAGLYCDKKIIGSGNGDTIETAVDQASLNALWKLWGTLDGRLQFPFCLNVTNVLQNSQLNVSLQDWNTKKAGSRVALN